jgi:SAM-dependent methyltransferase
MSDKSTELKTVDGTRLSLPPGIDAQIWQSPESLTWVEYSKYWNDEEIERSKSFYVLDHGFARLEQYVAGTGLAEDFKECVRRLEAEGRRVGGIGLDLAAGVLWMLPVVFETVKPSHVTCLEYSFHRLMKVGPEVIRHYRLPAERITLALGSFYDIRLPPASVDFILLCQAFHHADRPAALVAEMARVLKRDGVIIIVGEEPCAWRLKNDLIHLARYFGMRVLPQSLHRSFLRSPYGVPKRLIARSDEVFRPDPVLGDHLHMRRDYRRLFRAGGFKVRFYQRAPAGKLCVLAYRV